MIIPIILPFSIFLKSLRNISTEGQKIIIKRRLTLTDVNVVSRAPPCIKFAINPPKDLSRPLIDFFCGFQRLVDKVSAQNQTACFFR